MSNELRGKVLSDWIEGKELAAAFDQLANLANAVAYHISENGASGTSAILMRQYEQAHIYLHSKQELRVELASVAYPAEISGADKEPGA